MLVTTTKALVFSANVPRLTPEAETTANLRPFIMYCFALETVPSPNWIARLCAVFRATVSDAF